MQSDEEEISEEESDDLYCPPTPKETVDGSDAASSVGMKHIIFCINFIATNYRSYLLHLMYFKIRKTVPVMIVLSHHHHQLFQ